MPQQRDSDFLWPGEAYDILARSPGVAYRIYPSILDKYQQLLDYAEEAEAWWNYKDGIQKLSPEDIYDRTERELIDMINRVPHEPSEAADRGTSLNEVVDCLILRQPCTRADMSIQTLRSADDPFAIRCDYDGFTFEFDVNLCRRLRDMLTGSLCQCFIEAPIETSYGTVLIYGFMDYWLHDRIIDLKSTSKYTFGNYERKWQRHAYPYCAITSGLTETVSEFTYLVAELSRPRGTSVYTGTVYPETYTYDHRRSTAALREHIESFIGWLNDHRHLITDQKIFNQLTA